jgi:hypothetical protein
MQASYDFIELIQLINGKSMLIKYPLFMARISMQKYEDTYFVALLNRLLSV